MAITQAELDRILGKQSVVQRAFDANQPTVTNTPRSMVSGTWADILKPIVSNPVGEFVGAADMQRALDSASYNKPLTTGGSVQTGGFRPEYLAAALGLTPVGKGKKVANVAAQKMSAAEAKAAGYWHPIGEKKLKMPYNEMTSVVVPYENATVPKIINPESLLNTWGLAIKGDRANIGRLEEINGQKLFEPVELEGGPRYMDKMNQFNEIWASGKGKVSSYFNKIDPLLKKGNDVNLIYTTAGHPTTDYNAMMTDALFEQMKGSKISNKSTNKFDEIMRERRPEWAGLNNPKAREQLSSNGALRHVFHDVVSLEDFQKAGFPDMAATRKAVTDPNLLDTPNSYSGYRIGKVNPDNIIIPNSAIPHTTYPISMGGNLVGEMGVQLPSQNFFPDFYAGRRASGAPVSGDAYSFERSLPVQQFDQKWLDQIMPVYERMLKEGLIYP